MKRENVLLLFMTAARGEPFNTAQIIKGMFILRQEMIELFDVESIYCFRKGDYGPACSEIIADLETLRIQGYVIPSYIGAISVWAASVKGADLARSWLFALSGSKADYLKTLSEFVLKLSFADLVAAVRKQYPDSFTDIMTDGV